MALLDSFRDMHIRRPNTRPIRCIQCILLSLGCSRAFSFVRSPKAGCCWLRVQRGSGTHHPRMAASVE